MAPSPVMTLHIKDVTPCGSSSATMGNGATFMIFFLKECSYYNVNLRGKMKVSGLAELESAVFFVSLPIANPLTAC
jgi:hypothetical protein